MTDTATKVQNDAAKPDQSTWLSANAGSGKTRVLTNRVARLLLHRVSPQNILCLTYTKAAASEMQNRLFKTLGAWAMLEDQKLRDALGALGEDTTGDLAKARTLFASAIEAPGGLKIQTIHSLCSSILRQFPLEAGVNPQFRELDELQQTLLIEDVLNSLSISAPQTITRVSGFCPDDTLATMACNISQNADKFATLRGKVDIFAFFNLSPDLTMDRILTDTLSVSDITFLKSLIPVLRLGGTRDNELADQFERLPDNPSVRALGLLEKKLLLSKAPFEAKLTSVPTKPTRLSPEFQPLLPEFHAIMQRVEAARENRITLEAAEKTLAIDSFARLFLPAYDAAKKNAGVLDFDDLIRHARALLTRQSMQWVMYRLDGRIDHILVDEAQDTSPMQWDVIEALAEEMASGEGDRSRTLFVVGDKKQSIYSFQGADAAGFDLRADSFRERLAEGQGLRAKELQFSFRSSPAILSAVDHVFADQSGFDGCHQAYHTDMAGRVDLWPLIENPAIDDDKNWYETGDRTVENTGAHQLAEAVADKIASMIGKETIQGENGPRLIEAGDFIVLVQRRSALFDGIIQACKIRKLDIAGADRLKIGSELAVRDLLALLSFLALPDDSLSLAAALRSPLLGWSEQDLFTLAARRNPKLTLWTALRQNKETCTETHQMLSGLLDAVDYLRPFELLDRILTRHDGRVRLLDRLGREAEDGINELLNQALAYERNDVPSLTGFLNVTQASDIEVKRQSDNTGGQIRVMTVHAAKGLESPIVILPDTMFGDPRAGSDLVDADGLPVPPIATDNAPSVIAAAKERKRNADREERKRLLYVAMTRAEKWLIVCGVKPSKSLGKDVTPWHQMVSEGLQRAGAETIETTAGQGLRLHWGKWPDRAKTPDSETALTGTDPLPDFGNASAPDARKKSLSPSDLGGAKVIGGGALEEDQALRRGRQIHLLLEHIAHASDPEATARNLLSFGPDAATSDEIPGLLAETQQTIDRNPGLFTTETLAEVSVVADLPGLDARMSGIIDRLLVSDDRVLAVDFKTNAVVPETPEATPEGLLRQMGAYLTALEQIYPTRRIEVAILWTATGELMPLEHGIVRDALLRTPTS